MLGVEMRTTIRTLFLQGYNKTQIADIINVDRKTIRKVITSLSDMGTVERKRSASILDPYIEYINIQVSKKLSAMRIYQDMERDLCYTGSYDTVKRYISQIKKNPQKAYMVMTSLPGEEAQVDFGYIGTLKLPDQKRKKAWVFVMELSYSRYMFAEIVFDQTVATFIDCHKKAFKYFNGIPRTVKLDNLKAGILEANFYEPIVQKNYAAFASHCGFLANPCRIKTPTDKGKVESNIKYVKESCFKGREFKTNEEASAFLLQWLQSIANARTHGSTRKIPFEVFNLTEKKNLFPLPNKDYILPTTGKYTVMSNCHISYKGNYYSVPHLYIGQKVSIVAADAFLKVFCKENEIACHDLVKNIKGKYVTTKEHYPSFKNITTEEINSAHRDEMAQIGEHALIFFDKFRETVEGKFAYRSVLGILHLRKKYDAATINNACQLAYSLDSIKYKTVKMLCEQSLSSLQVNVSKSYINIIEVYQPFQMPENLIHTN